MAKTTERPTAAFVLSLIGGIFVLLAGIFFGIVGLVLTLPFGGFGAAFGIIGILWGVLIIIGAVMMENRPGQSTMWGVLVLVVSFVSWYGAVGGFFIGFLLAFIGGILAIAWHPSHN